MYFSHSVQSFLPASCKRASSAGGAAAPHSALRTRSSDNAQSSFASPPARNQGTSAPSFLRARPYRHRRLAEPRADVFVGAQVRGEIAVAGVEIDDIEPAERLRLALLSLTANFRGLQSWR